MTYQRDPDVFRPNTVIRREDGSYNLMPAALAVVFALIIGYVIFSWAPATNTPVTTSELLSVPALSDLWLAPASTPSRAGQPLRDAVADVADGRAARALPVFARSIDDSLVGGYALLYFEVEFQRVHQQEVGSDRQLAHRFHHCHARRMIDIDLVDPRCVHSRYGACDTVLLDARCQLFAIFFLQQLGIAQPAYPIVRIKDHGACHHGYKQRAAAYLVHSANELRTRLPRRLLMPGGAMESFQQPHLGGGF